MKNPAEFYNLKVKKTVQPMGSTSVMIMRWPRAFSLPVRQAGIRLKQSWFTTKRIERARKLKPVCLNTLKYSIIGLENIPHWVTNHLNNMNNQYSNKQYDYYRCPFFCCKIKTRDKVKQDIFEYIEVFYNRQRLHSASGYKTPIEYGEMKHVA